jgi:hypothetical protein
VLLLEGEGGGDEKEEGLRRKATIAQTQFKKI